MQTTAIAPGASAPATPLIARLRAELRNFLARVEANDVFAALADGSISRDAYVAFLVETRHYVNRTSPTLSAAQQGMERRGQDRAFAALFGEKAEEEKDHDLVIDRDLAALGVDADRALAGGPGRWVQSYRAWIAAVTAGRHPLAFLGTAYLLEGLSVAKAAAVSRALRASGRIENVDAALSFIDMAGAADVGHLASLEDRLAAVVDPVEADEIVMSAAATRTWYLGMLDEVADATGGSRIAA